MDFSGFWASRDPPFWFAAAEHLRLAEELRSEQFDPKGRELFAHLQIFSTISPRPLVQVVY